MIAFQFMWPIFAAGLASGLIVIALVRRTFDQATQDEQLQEDLKRREVPRPPGNYVSPGPPDPSTNPDHLVVEWRDGAIQRFPIYAHLGETSTHPKVLILHPHRIWYRNGTAWYTSGEIRINTDHVRMWRVERAEPILVDDEGVPLDDPPNDGVG